MRKYITVKTGRFVLTGYGFEQFKVRKLLAQDNKRVPVDWVDRGYVTYIKEGN